MTPEPDRRRRFSWVVWILVAGGIATLFPLWLPLLVAAWFAHLARPLVDGVTRRLGGRRRLAVWLALGLFLLVLLPITGAIAQLVVAGSELVTKFMANKEWRGALQSLVSADGGTEISPTDILNPKQILAMVTEHGTVALGILQNIFGATTTAVVGVFVFLLSCHRFLSDGEQYWAWTLEHAPIEPRIMQRLGAAFHETGRGLVIGIGFTCATQAIVATIAYTALGVPRALLLGELTFFAAFIPSFGTAVIWVPVAAGLALTQNYVKAAILAGIGILVVGTIDNVLGPTFSRWGKLDLPVYILIISIFGGFAVFGAWGFLLGPLLVRLAKEALVLAREER